MNSEIKKEQANSRTYTDKPDYDDIINLPHPVSKRHPQMSLLNRAAQFSPFAALTGHDAAIRETARLTDSFMELDENLKEELDEKLRLLKENLSQKPKIEATYFQPDERKSGGAYVTVCGRVKRMNGQERRIVFTDGTVLPIDYLFEIRGDMFRNMETSGI